MVKEFVTFSCMVVYTYVYFFDCPSPAISLSLANSKPGRPGARGTRVSYLDRIWTRSVPARTAAHGVVQLPAGCIPRRIPGRLRPCCSSRRGHAARRGLHVRWRLHDLGEGQGLVAVKGGQDAGWRSRRRDCHSAPHPSPFGRCFNMDGEGVSAE